MLREVSGENPSVNGRGCVLVDRVKYRNHCSVKFFFLASLEIIKTNCDASSTHSQSPSKKKKKIILAPASQYYQKLCINMWRATAHVFRHHERNNKSENYIVFSKERVQTFPVILLNIIPRFFVSRSAMPNCDTRREERDCFAVGSLPFSFFLTAKFFFLTRSFWRTRKWLVSFLSGGRVSFFCVLFFAALNWRRRGNDRVKNSFSLCTEADKYHIYQGQ